MPTDWSDDIVITELSDEPALSEDLAGIIDRLSGAGDTVPHVVLNFTAVSYVNSSNLAQLIKIRKILDTMGRLLVLCSVDTEVRSVFKVTGLERLFRFAPDPMTALAGVQIEMGG